MLSLIYTWRFYWYSCYKILNDTGIFRSQRKNKIPAISSIFHECRGISDSIFEILCFQYMFWITLYMFRLFFPESDRYEYFKTKLSRDKNRDWESCAKEVVSRW